MASRFSRPPKRFGIHSRLCASNRGKASKRRRPRADRRCVLVEPEQGITDQEVADLAAAVVEDERAPILVFAEARVGVFVEMGAVEVTQAVLVARKVRGTQSR